MPTPLIDVSGLYASYKGEDWVLANLNLSIQQGEYVAIIGQNGSGKTTLVKHFDGLLIPKRGVVRVDGVDTRELSLATLAGKVGYCYQNPDHQIFNATVAEEIEFGPINMGVDRQQVAAQLKEILATVGLDGLQDEYPFSLSRGQRQKLAVASILVMNPPMMVVDEPTTGLDWRDGTAMMELIQKLNEAGRTIVIITHDMRLVANYAKRVIVMSGGKIIADGATREIFAQPEILRQSYLEPPQITRLAQRLTADGVPPDILSVDEAERAIRPLLGKGEPHVAAIPAV